MFANLTEAIMSFNDKGSQLRDYLEVYSLSSDQVVLRVQLKTFSKLNGWTFNFCFRIVL